MYLLYFIFHLTKKQIVNFFRASCRFASLRLVYIKPKPAWLHLPFKAMYLGLHPNFMNQNQSVSEIFNFVYWSDKIGTVTIFFPYYPFFSFWNLTLYELRPLVWYIMLQFSVSPYVLYPTAASTSIVYSC